MIYNLLHTNAIQYPSDIAVVADGVQWSYKHLLEQVNAVGQELTELGVIDSRLCLAGPNNADAIAFIFGIAKTGNAVIPADYYLTKDEFRILCEQSKADYAIVHEDFMLPLLGEQTQKTNAIRIRATSQNYMILALTDKPLRSVPKKSWLTNLFSIQKAPIESAYALKEKTPCLFFSSSGSTGKPKIFALSHSQLYYQMTYLRDATPFLPTDSTLCCLHFSHSHAICLIFGALGSGGAIHLMRVKDALAPNIAKHIAAHKISIFSHVPLIYKAFVDLKKHLPERAFQSIRIAICGSAPLSADVAQFFYDHYGIHLHQGYGLSEIGTMCLNNFDEGDYNYYSVGKVFPEIEYKVIGDNGQPVQAGDQGQLIARSAGLTDGYIDNPEANKLMFQDGWLYTQDIVTEDTYGNIRIIGRLSNFINVGGFKVFPAEIERAIMNIPEVAEVAVIDQQDDFFGQIAKAFVVLHQKNAIQAHQIQQHCKQELSSFKVPKEVVFLDELPKNGIGKVVAGKLKEL